MRAFRVLALCAALCGTVGCRNKEKEARRDQLIDLMHGNTGDADIAAAIKKSRETVGEFLAVLKSPGPNQRQFLVRREFPTAVAGKVQILIVNNVTFDGTLLHGKVDDNTSRPGSGIARGGDVSFPPAEVCDWMYNDNGKAAGGYMLRALKLKMTPDEWSKIAAQVTFKDE
jgi:uncharacterized protein YegJ (DUF2314 family)